MLTLWKALSNLLKNMESYMVLTIPQSKIFIALLLMDRIPKDPELGDSRLNVSIDQYREIILAHLEELWSKYGHITEVWFDGGYDESITLPAKKLFEKYIPHAIVFQGVSQNPIRWIGNEDGIADPNTWSTATLC